MASNPLIPVVGNVFLTTSFTTLYTVESGVSKFGIDAACFNNTSNATPKITYSVRLVQSGSSDPGDELITNKTIRAEQNDLAPGIIGQALLTGGQIQAKASEAGVVSVSITGTKVS